MNKPELRQTLAPSQYDSAYERMTDEIDCLREHIFELEKYCNELEATLKCTQESWWGTMDNLDKYMKALDKACKKLYWYTRYFIDAEGVSSEEELKERFLNDE